MTQNYYSGLLVIMLLRLVQGELRLRNNAHNKLIFDIYMKLCQQCDSPNYFNSENISTVIDMHLDM